jgi:hypothetical protein
MKKKTTPGAFFDISQLARIRDPFGGREVAALEMTVKHYPSVIYTCCIDPAPDSSEQAKIEDRRFFRRPSS